MCVKNTRSYHFRAAIPNLPDKAAVPDPEPIIPHMSLGLTTVGLSGA